MIEPLIERIAHDEGQIHLAPDSAYLRSYPEFLRYFQVLTSIEYHHLIIAANFTYGWMPTTLRFKSDGFDQAVTILNRAKTGEQLGDDDFLCLAKLINNSVVGMSKLLHWVNPEHYAIWDSRVGLYLRNTPYCPATYANYLDLCRVIVNHLSFLPIHDSINKKVGYSVSGMRAVELVMYATGSGNGPE